MREWGRSRWISTAGLGMAGGEGTTDGVKARGKRGDIDVMCVVVH